MTRGSIALKLALSTVLVLSIGVACLGFCFDTSVLKFPNTNRSSYGQYEVFGMNQGWANDDLVWYVCTDSSDIRTSCTKYFLSTIYWWSITYAPRLSEALPNVATVYVVKNVSQGPVFSALPGDPTYSGLWKVVYITFKQGFARPVTNALPAGMGNPQGLPPISEADYSPADPNDATIVIKCPIVATGQLGGPWVSSPGRYRIPQGKVEPNYAALKVIWLPFWYVYCQDPITKRPGVRRIIVPDAYDPPALPDADKLVPKLGANDSPGLALIPLAAVQRLYWLQGPQPVNQYPILQACPSDPFFPCKNSNMDYSPVEQVTVLDRLIPPSSVINNPLTAERLRSAGLLPLIRESQLIDGAVIPELPPVIIP